MADVFNFEADQPIEVSLNDIVGEGKKYSNPDELAKAYAHVENHARTLEAENAQLRASRDVNDATNKNQKTPEEIEREQLQNKQDQANSEAPKNSSAPDVNDFRSQIRDEVRALNEQDRAKANMDLAATRMVEVFGSEQAASEAIHKRAQELDVSVEWLKDSASRSPSAFYASMGITGTGGNRSTPSSTPEVRLQDNSNTRNFEFFDKMRKEDPKLYFSANTQTEMLQEAKRQGADFYKR